MATTHYPLLFDYDEVLSGFGCPIRVTLKGRALASESDGVWWISGVNPGAVAGGGRTFQSAFIDFRRRIKAVCIDFLVEAPDFASFKREVESFFHERDDLTADEWEAARAAVRSGATSLPGVEMESEPAEPSVEVRIATRAYDNVIDSEPAIAA